MKKILFLALVFFCGILYAQTNVTVSLDNDVYVLLQNMELRGYCSALSPVKPYTEKYIVERLEEAAEYLEENTYEEELTAQKKIIAEYLERFEHEEGLKLAALSFRKEGDVFGVPVSIEINDNFNAELSGGLYNESDNNSFAFNIYNVVDFSGDLGEHISWRNQTFLGAARVPLKKIGEYKIGYWYSSTYNQPSDFENEPKPKDKNDYAYKCTQTSRTINIFKNYSYLPYSYNKFWDGSVYDFEEGINAGGLGPWPNTASLAFGMKGEIRGVFLNDIVELAAGRMEREWAGMDNGASLVLNANARPFFAGEMILRPFKWLSLKSLTGVLEMPNRGDMLSEAFYPVDENGKDTRKKLEDQVYNDDEYKDYHYFQNAFSIGEVDLDFKYLHLDFGSSCVWPKRFELGYSFPLIDRIVYQNDVGDYDNLALFGNMKIRYPGVGYGWFSFYLDELNAFLTKFWKNTRAMYAFQLGAKLALPDQLPYGTFSFRYTRVEPYCYTHQSINGTPWYSGYLNENYSNNGYSLGYYLQPNSDEILLKVDCKPNASSNAAFQYQLIRHGADFGPQSIPGSNLYSELPRRGRGDLRKNFLFDGAYEWSHIWALSGSYKFNTKLPFSVYANAGVIYDYFTSIAGKSVSIYEHEDRFSVNEDNFHVNEGDYKDSVGGVLTLGITLFGR